MSEKEEEKIAHLKVYYSCLYKIIAIVDVIVKQNADEISYRLGCILEHQIDNARNVHSEFEKFLEKHYPEEYPRYEEIIKKLQLPKKSKIVV